MPLQFINRLDEKQIIDLINYISLKEDYVYVAKEVQIFAEPDRCDELGNQEILVNAWNGTFHIGTYKIQDYTINNLFCGYKSRINELREYLASVFGEEYLEALREYYAMEAEIEIKRIENALGKGKC